MYKILIVEDDPVISNVLGETLVSWGNYVRQSEDFSSVYDLFCEFSPHLVILDLSLPQRSGFYWCSEIRKSSNVPIIFISSASDSMNMVTALHQGADDFITKPFDLHILMAKVQALLRRSYDFSPAPENITAKGAVLNLGEMNISYRECCIELTRNEFLIVRLLMENMGSAVSRDRIMRHLWEDESFIDDNTLTVNINRLRKKLETYGLNDFITTKKGVGYMIAAEGKA